MSSPNRTGMSKDDDVVQNCGSKVGMESLLLAVPFVCKSWYKTCLNPLCWQNLSFPDFLPYPLFIDNDEEDVGPHSFGPFYDKFVNEYGIDRSRFSITAFVKSVVDRSNGKATHLTLPEFCTEEALRIVKVLKRVMKKYQISQLAFRNHTYACRSCVARELGVSKVLGVH